jgi:hypothetical protein
MALKFRRGTTAQQSGSLAFGEPFVNTTLGTLIVGGTDGDIVLSAGGTGSTGNFGPISGSGLDITGNANIAGNLTLGGQLTIGDATSDTVNVVASLSSSLIPQTTKVFDLGSTTKEWDKLYASTANFSGDVNITGSLIVSGSNIEFTRDWPAVGSESHFLRVAPFTSSTGRYYDGIGIGVEHWDDGTGTYEHSLQIHSWDNHISPNYGAELNVGPYRTHMRVYPSGSNGDYSNVSVQELTNGKTQALVYADFVQIGGVAAEYIIIGNTGSVVQISGSVNANITGSLSGSVSGIGNVSTYSASVDSRIATEKGRVDAILSASEADKDSFAEIVTLINSVDTTNDNAFASFYTASVGRLNNLESTSASLSIETANLESFSSSALTRLTALEVETANLEAFTSSINTTIKTRLNAETVVSGSSQITLSSTTGGGTSADVRFGSLGIGMAASGTSGRIDAAGDIVAFSTSDKNFKENITPIPNALDKISKISGNTYDWKVENKDIHGFEGNDVGVIAQEIEAVLPQLVTTRETGYKAVKYDKLVALLIEGIKEQQTQIHSLTLEIEKLKESKGL